MPLQKNGDMREILSLRQGPVKTACLLPSLTGMYVLQLIDKVLYEQRNIDIGFAMTCH